MFKRVCKHCGFTKIEHTKVLLSVLYMTLVWSFTPFISPNPSLVRQLAIVPGGSQLGGELDVEVMYGSGGAPLYKASVYVPKVPD